MPRSRGLPAGQTRENPTPTAARSLFFLSQFPVASGAASQNRQTPMACSHTPSQTIFESEDSYFRQRDMLALARSVSRTRERRRRAH